MKLIWELRFDVRGEYNDQSIWVMATTSEAALWKGRRYLKRKHPRVTCTIHKIELVGTVDVL